VQRRWRLTQRESPAKVLSGLLASGTPSWKRPSLLQSALQN
jgi:hypothetical protein